MVFSPKQVFPRQVYAPGSEEAACMLFGGNVSPSENLPSESHFAVESLGWFQVTRPTQRPSFERSLEYTAFLP
ncbi:hypothetical protein NPIL_222901, partial [Nephila pilipes]